MSFFSPTPLAGHSCWLAAQNQQQEVKMLLRRTDRLKGGKHTECCLVISEAKTKGRAACLRPGIIRLHTQFISGGAGGDTPLVYRTARQARRKIHTPAFFYNGSEF